jgi:hypothetical protein
MRSVIWVAAACISGVALVGCGASNDDFAAQTARYEQQLDITDVQLKENERLLQRQEQLSERTGKLLDRWEAQADQIDTLLKEVDRRVSTSR